MLSRLKTERVTLQSFYKTIKPIEFIVDQYDMTHFDGDAPLGQSETRDGVDMVWVTWVLAETDYHSLSVVRVRV